MADAEYMIVSALRAERSVAFCASSPVRPNVRPSWSVERLTKVVAMSRRAMCPVTSRRLAPPDGRLPWSPPPLHEPQRARSVSSAQRSSRSCAEQFPRRCERGWTSLPGVDWPCLSPSMFLVGSDPVSFDHRQSYAKQTWPLWGRSLQLNFSSRVDIARWNRCFRVPVIPRPGLVSAATQLRLANVPNMDIWLRPQTRIRDTRTRPPAEAP